MCNNDYPPKFDVIYNMNHTCKVVGTSLPSSTLDSSPPCSNNEVAACPESTIFTELELEELLSTVPDIHTPSMEDVIPSFVASWDFTTEWNNIDELLGSNEGNCSDEGRAF